MLLVCVMGLCQSVRAQVKASDFSTEDLFYTNPGLRITPYVWTPGLEGDIGPDAARVPLGRGAME